MAARYHAIKGDADKVLAATPSGADITRLMVSLNALDTVHRAFFITFDPEFIDEWGTDVERGDRLVLLTIVCGMLKEAVDAFWCVKHLFENLEARDPATPLPKTEYTKLCIELDKDDPNGPYKQLLVPTRDKAAFHWSRERIICALATLQGQEIEVCSLYDRPSKPPSARMTAADAVIAHVVVGKRQRDETKQMFAVIKTITERFTNVVEAYLAEHMLENGCRLEAK